MLDFFAVLKASKLKEVLQDTPVLLSEPLILLSESDDEDTITEECMKIFQEYEPVPVQHTVKVRDLSSIRVFTFIQQKNG